MHESVRNSGSRRYAWGIGVLHGAGLRRRDHLQRVEGRR
jgi:hypothetical protein